MPKRMTLSDKALYRAVVGPVQAALIASPKYRNNPELAAHWAREHAMAQVRETRIADGKRK